MRFVAPSPLVVSAEVNTLPYLASLFCHLILSRSPHPASRSRLSDKSLVQCTIRGAFFKNHDSLGIDHTVYRLNLVEDYAAQIRIIASAHQQDIVHRTTGQGHLPDL